jgi:hypothetical protein
MDIQFFKIEFPPFLFVTTMDCIETYCGAFDISIKICLDNCSFLEKNEGKIDLELERKKLSECVNEITIMTIFTMKIKGIIMKLLTKLSENLDNTMTYLEFKSLEDRKKLAYTTFDNNCEITSKIRDNVEELIESFNSRHKDVEIPENDNETIAATVKERINKAKPKK